MNTRDYRVELNETSGTRVYQYNEETSMWDILGLVYNVKTEYEAVARLLDEVNHRTIEYRV